MLENLSFFFHIILDTAWVIEALLTGLAWIILCWQKGSWKRLVPAFAGLFFYQLIVGSMLYGFLGISGAYPLLNKLLRGAGFLLMLHYLSPYQWKTDELLHCVLFNVMLSVSALAGQSSILVGSLVRSGSPEALTRCLIHFLLPLAALYLRRYNFDEFEMVPTSCINLELTLCLGILVVNITESCLMTLDTSVVLAFLSGYFSLAVTSLITIRAVYTMCREQSDIIQLRAEKQRFQAEREITKIAQKTLDDLRCIRHDLKNQYSYMQILLEGGRYDELKEYFQKLQENLPPQLNLIDWEYAGMSDYASDYGTFVVTCMLGEEEAEHALACYFGHTPTPQEHRHNLAHVALAGWCWYVWALQKESEGDYVGDWMYTYYRYAKKYLSLALEEYEGAER